jgi:hypothetical protein
MRSEFSRVLSWRRPRRPPLGQDQGKDRLPWCEHFIKGKTIPAGTGLRPGKNISAPSTVGSTCADALLGIKKCPSAERATVNTVSAICRDISVRDWADVAHGLYTPRCRSATTCCVIAAIPGNTAMKRTLGPTWTAEQIAEGERFKQGWLDFFGRRGAAVPEAPPVFDAEAGNLASIRATHEARLLAYPNVVGVTEGTRMRRGKLTHEPVITVLVSRKIPRNSLTKASLLPSHIDGTPIDVVEVGPIEALESGLHKARTQASDVGRRRRKRIRIRRR